MEHADHVRLLREGVPPEAGTWADLGSGEGAFTLALAELLAAGSTIHAIDRDAGALDELVRRYGRLAASIKKTQSLHPHVADFTGDLGLSSLDGIVMANSLHFIADKTAVLARVRAMLRPGARLLLIEYDTDSGNRWVPHPLSFETWRRVAVANGFDEPRLLATESSRFLRRMYSALALARDVKRTTAEV